MKIAISQMNPRVGDVACNLKLILEAIKKAKAGHCQLLLFPELAIVGYPPRDLLSYSHIVDENLKALEKIKVESSGITILIGYVEKNLSNSGKPYFNSVAVFQNGNLIKNYRKWLLPYYDIFEEERYFEPGNETVVFQVMGKNIGLTICEDLWNEPGFLPRDYAKKPIEALMPHKLDLLVNISASPFQIGKTQIREKLFQQVSKKIKAPVVFCNQVGANDELIFDGASFVITEQGKQMQAKAFEVDFQEWNLETKPCLVTNSFTTEAGVVIEALALGIRDYVEKSRLKTVCIGLSGGIDSSVVAALAVKALGPKRVFGFALPSKFNASHSLEDAEILAANLGITCNTISIETLFQEFEKQLTKTLGQCPKSLTLENIQPRIRMTLLMGLANEAGHLLLNTSNKSEIAMGYATQYGDTAGAIAVLGDLTKHQVYSLAQEINLGTEVIPYRAITRAPSAELKENQKDQDSLPSYDILDKIVESHIEQSQPLSPGSAPETPIQFIQLVSRLNAASEYKRHQLPPVLRVSSKAFGMGRRIPIVGRKPSE